MNKVAVVTGASRGIGRAIAIRYAKEGYRLAICCKKSEAELLKTKKEILSFHTDCITYIGDMGVFSDVQAFFSEIMKVYGRIDVLINNAGISHTGLLQDMSVSDWNTVMASNLDSVFYCSKSAIPYMLSKKSGKILSISSIWGNAGASMEVAYSASKGGINAFTKALAKELAPSGIQVNAVACGIIDTSMNDFLTEEERSVLCDEIPSGRFGTCAEAAELVYLLNEKNDYLTGQVITLDGGFL